MGLVERSVSRAVATCGDPEARTAGEKKRPITSSSTAAMPLLEDGAAARLHRLRIGQPRRGVGEHEMGDRSGA